MKVRIRLSRIERLFVLLVIAAFVYAGSLVTPQKVEKPVELLKVATVSAQYEEAVVARVIDGDTIELDDGRIVRYIGIDTPETVHPKKGMECFGNEAKEENKRLVEGYTVTLEKDISEVDRYGRLLRYVWRDPPDGEAGDVMINWWLVQKGFAHVVTYPPDVAFQELLLKGQQEAREQGRGIWTKCTMLNAE